MFTLRPSKVRLITLIDQFLLKVYESLIFHNHNNSLSFYISNKYNIKHPKFSKRLFLDLSVTNLFFSHYTVKLG